MNFLERAQAIEERIIDWRRTIHQNPELGFEETKTAAFVAATLREMGVEVEVGVGRTGIVARLGNGEGRKIGIRADMDALPIDEAVDLPFKSQVAGKMHACGHDAHTAMLMGVASVLNEMDIDGEIRLLFQPSEERWEDDGTSGATAMIADNALAELDQVLALHVDSTLPAGQVRVGDGYLMAAVDIFHAVITGEGTHGAAPHMGVDPIFIQAQVISAIQGIVARQIDPNQPAVVTIGEIHGGTANNIIPHEVTISGTIRTFSDEIRAQVHDDLDRAFSIAQALGGDYTLDIQRGYPAVYNDPSTSDSIGETARHMLGDDNIIPATPAMFAEDFSYMTQEVPGAMFMLGAKYDDQHRPHHSPIFAISEEPLKYGTAILAETAYNLLKNS